MEESLRQQILAAFPHSPVDIRTYSPMAFAFLGDAVYSLVVRTMVISKGNRQAEKLHNETSLLVRASTQAAIGESIQDLLTEEERSIYKRGKNANTAHHARSASYEDYQKATGLECLCGYLYLQDRAGRMLDLIREGMDRAGVISKQEKGRT